jgi:hypothetical protein
MMETNTTTEKAVAPAENSAEKEMELTQTQFIEHSNLDARLIKAVVRQIGGWESFTESAEDIANHGIDGGFSGFIYYRDTEPFARRNRALIADMASEQASEFGMGVIEMIRGFGCFRHGTKPTDEEIGSALYAGKDAEDGLPVLNALAWYAGEEVARSFVDWKEALTG